MRKRLQTINGDTVLEKTEDVPHHVRYSENSLRRKKEYLEASIADFRAALAEVDAQLAEIHAEKGLITR